MGLLDGKVAIVTGGGRGIGREHALLLAKEGASVVVNDLGGDGRGEGTDPTPAETVVSEIEAAGGVAVANGVNVADWGGAEGLIEQAVETFGRLDILVNNAGILRDRLVFNMSEEEFDVVVNVVLKGTFAPSRHAAAYWKALNKKTEQPVNGVIINTASESGMYGNGGQTNYVAAKAGIGGMTITMARDLSRIGVRVNAICPGAMTRLLGTVAAKWRRPRTRTPGCPSLREPSRHWSPGLRPTTPAMSTGRCSRSMVAVSSCSRVGDR